MLALATIVDHAALIEVKDPTAIGEISEKVSTDLMKRLRRLLALRFRASKFLDSRDVHLLDEGITATLGDLIDLGLREQAVRLIEEMRASVVEN